MGARSRRARIGGVHELAMGMPHVTVLHGPHDNPIYQVGAKSFVFFRNPRPDAVDPDTGERYPDVIMFWVTSEADKQALVQDQGSPFFSTPGWPGPRLPGPPPGSPPEADQPLRAPGGTTSGRRFSWRRYPSASRSW